MIGATIVGSLCTLLLGSLIGAVILRAACWLFNKMAGGSKSGGVPEPEMGRAMGIVFVAMIVLIGFRLVLSLALGADLNSAQSPTQGPQLIAGLIAFPVSFLVMAGLLAAMLPTTFLRGLVVAVLYSVIAIVVFGAAIALIAVFIGGAMFLSNQ